MSSTDTPSLSAASLSSVRLLMGLQLSVRLITFTFNQALLRTTSPRAFGTVAIHFELLLSTILFLSREGVRNTLLRVWPSPTESEKNQGKVPSTLSNLTYLPIAIGFPLALTASFVYWRQSSNETRSQPHFEASIAVYALAALVELFSEPMHIRAMGELRTSVRVRAEALGVVGKAVTTFIIMFIDSNRPNSNEEYSLLAFAAGQLMYAILVLIMYLIEYPVSLSWTKSVSSILSLKSIRSSVDNELLRLSLTMTSQSVVKHVLTEGDKLLISRLSPLDDQGGYAVAVNYGSLVARIVFQPIEESLRLYFSKLLSSPSPKSSASPSSEPSSLLSLAEASTTITHLLSTQLSLSAILLTFGPPYLSIALHIALPPRYLATSAPKVLQAWLWYMPVLAVNGGLEAFVGSVAGPEEVNRQSRWMAGFSIIYILSSVGFYSAGFGDTSLVYANIVNLLSRIAYCASFTSVYFTSRASPNSPSLLQWRRVLPDIGLLVMLGASGAVIRWYGQRIRVEELLSAYERSVIFRRDVVNYVVLGVGLGLLSLLSWWMRSGRELLRSRRVKSD